METEKQQPYYRLGAEAVLQQLETSSQGLSPKEARQRLVKYGSNALERRRPEPAIMTFLRQFKNLLVVLLLFSAAFALYLRDAKTAVVLIAIALVNAGVGYFQEHKAESLLRNLEHLLVPQAKVLRGGKLEAINSTELVPGDIVYIESGDSVPADLRILDENELGTNDFALTGESNPSRKFVHAISGDVPLGNRHNIAFAGTTVATGVAHGIVVATGMRTELGRIASLSQNSQPQESPLQQEMNHLAVRITQATVVLAVILTLIALHGHVGVQAAILFGIGVGAAMIPEGLVAEVNITLAQAASRLAQRKALVKKLSAVETLGATNYILTDKTGTLTRNEMTVHEVLVGRSRYGVTGSGYEPTGDIVGKNKRSLQGTTLQALELFFTAGVLASNARVNPPDEEHATWYVVGDPTEGALVTLARKASLDIDSLEANQPEIKEFQFDSARKLLSSVRQRPGGQTVVFVKGAPEAVLGRSTELWDHGHIRKLTPADRAYFDGYNEQQAKAAMRNLAFGFRILPKTVDLKKLTMERVEQDFTFLGMVSMQDPLRSAVPAAMAAAQHAHVKVSIITGDYPTTARAIAQQAGLDSITVVLSGDLRQMGDAEILQLLERGGAVFSRVSPEDKLRVAMIGKQAGRVVAVTGDGINDAPALKRADIGVAMGLNGTDVAKDAAEIVLLDDSFSSLVGAIEQGRLTFQNIKKAARCALTNNAAELFTVLTGLAALTLFHVAPAITAIQILAIDVVAQILPVTALGWDPAQRKLMREKPRDPRDHIINRRAVVGFIGFGVLAGVLAYANYLFFFARLGLSPRYLDPSLPLYHQATSLTYLTLVLCLYVYLLFERSDAHEQFFTKYLWSNKQLLVAFGASFVLIITLLYVPVISSLFNSAPLGFMDWLTALVCAGLYMAFRLIQRHTRRHTRRAVIKLHRDVHGKASSARV